MLVALALMAVILAGGWWLVQRGKRGGTAGPAGPAKPVAVAIATAEIRDVPIWLEGLGSVRAWNTVTVRPRVSGELVEVAFTEGQRVAKGDVLARIDRRPYEIARDQAAARLAQDEARLGAARRQLQASRDLLSAQAAGQLEYDINAATVGEIEATVRGDRATLADARLQLEYTEIVAPIAGRTGLRLVDVGNLVGTDAAGIVTITQLEPIAVIFTLPQDRLAEVRTAMKAAGDVAVEALGDGDSVLATGTLQLVDNEVDAQTGTISLKASFANEDHALWPGQLISARLRSATRTAAVVVPEQAVQPGADGLFVFVIGQDDTAELRAVERGPTQDGMTVITSGLAGGERVVIEGQQRLAPGAALEIREGGS